MAGVTVYVKANDDKRRIYDTLLIEGAALDLTSATVVCVLRGDNGTTWRRSASIEAPATNGKVYYDLTATDLGAVQVLLQEWEVTTSTSKIITYPPDDYNKIVIVGDLGN